MLPLLSSVSSNSSHIIQNKKHLDLPFNPKWQICLQPSGKDGIYSQPLIQEIILVRGRARDRSLHMLCFSAYPEQLGNEINTRRPCDTHRCVVFASKNVHVYKNVPRVMSALCRNIATFSWHDDGTVFSWPLQVSLWQRVIHTKGFKIQIQRNSDHRVIATSLSFQVTYESPKRNARNKNHSGPLKRNE